MKFKVRKLRGKDEIESYSDNLNINDQYSFFNEQMKLICVKFPVPKKGYKVKSIFNVGKHRIIIHISNGRQNPTAGRNKDWIMSGIFSISDIINVNTNPLILKEDDELTVLVYNDDRSFDENNILDNIDEVDFNRIESRPRTKFFIEKKFLPLPLPDEKEGGVIVEGP